MKWNELHVKKSEVYNNNGKHDKLVISAMKELSTESEVCAVVQ